MDGLYIVYTRIWVSLRSNWPLNNESIFGLKGLTCMLVEGNFWGLVSLPPQTHVASQAVTSVCPVTHYGSCQDTGSGVRILPSGLLQFASVWSDGERHAESPVTAECRSMPHHRSQTSWPHYAGAVSAALASCSAASGGECSNSPVVRQAVCGSTYAQRLRRQKLWRCRSMNLEQSTMWPANTWYQLQTF